jgi:hypothetical protein
MIPTTIRVCAGASSPRLHLDKINEMLPAVFRQAGSFSMCAGLIGWAEINDDQGLSVPDVELIVALAPQLQRRDG